MSSSVSRFFITKHCLSFSIRDYCSRSAQTGCNVEQMTFIFSAPNSSLRFAFSVVADSAPILTLDVEITGTDQFGEFWCDYRPCVYVPSDLSLGSVFLSLANCSPALVLQPGYSYQFFCVGE